MIAVRQHITKKALRRGILISAAAVALVAAAVAIHDPEAFTQRFDVSAAASIDRMSSGRTDTWSRALTMMSQAPTTVITGFGWHAYATLFLGYGDPHNVYLQYLFNLGLIGLSLFLFIIVWVYRFTLKGLKNADAQTRPLFIGFLMGWLAVLGSVFFVGLYLPWLFIWACTGTIVRLLIEVNRGANSNNAGATR